MQPLILSVVALSHSSFNSPRVLLQLQKHRRGRSWWCSFNSPRVLLQPFRRFRAFEPGHSLSILLESYCNQAGCNRLGANHYSFNSPRVLLQRGDGTDPDVAVAAFNSPRVLLQLERLLRGSVTNTLFQFSSSLIATGAKTRPPMAKSAFQFSSSLIATSTSTLPFLSWKKLSILLESYCNALSFITYSLMSRTFNSPRVLLQPETWEEAIIT